jgi:hypothetical protein
MQWIIDLNIGINHLGFELNGPHIWAKLKNLETRVTCFVTCEVYVVVNRVNQQALVIIQLINELQTHFPPQEVMDALEVVYLNINCKMILSLNFVFTWTPSRVFVVPQGSLDLKSYGFFSFQKQ